MYAFLVLMLPTVAQSLPSVNRECYQLSTLIATIERMGDERLTEQWKLADRLRMFQQLSGLSVKELAKRADIEPSYLRVLMSHSQRARSPRLPVLRRLARELSVTLDDLTGDQDPQKILGPKLARMAELFGDIESYMGRPLREEDLEYDAPRVRLFDGKEGEGMLKPVLPHWLDGRAPDQCFILRAPEHGLPGSKIAAGDLVLFARITDESPEPGMVIAAKDEHGRWFMFCWSADLDPVPLGYALRRWQE